ncbi:hypothetical protein B0H21DRAFT_826375 [Amylocystis lapponica]|nr:hypothetical protein B0H21DRAFT_826375 [Amylocystis lapponica]
MPLAQWVYVADIFPTRTWHYGLATVSGLQWLFSHTTTMVTNLKYKIFLMFATINVDGMAVFTLFIPETKGRSMDVIFDSAKREKRQADIQGQEQSATSLLPQLRLVLTGHSIRHVAVVWQYQSR